MKEGTKKFSLLNLFLIFFKIGLFTFGGGLAMIPLYRSEFCERRNWFSDEEMVDIIAITQTTPGVLAVNTAAFVGYRISKVRGAVAAALGAVLPSLIIILIVGMVYASVFENEYVVKAFRGVQCALAAMIVVAGIRMVKTTLKSPFAGVIVIISGVVSFFVESAVIYVIAFGALAGLIYNAVKKADKPSSNEEKKEGE